MRLVSIFVALSIVAVIMWVNTFRHVLSYHEAAYSGDLVTIRQQLSSGVNISERDESGNTALHWAAKSGSLEVIHHLLNEGIDIQATNEAGSTALHWGTYSDMPQVMETLLDAGAELDAMNEFGETPLHWAIQWQAYDAALVLVKRGASSVVRDMHGHAPFHLLPDNCPQIVKCVTVAHAMVAGTDEDSSSTSHKQKAEAVQQWLQEHGGTQRAAHARQETMSQPQSASSASS